MSMEAFEEAVQAGREPYEAIYGAEAERGARRARGNGIAGIDEERLATALGWVSIGLGVAQIAAPGSLARLIGLSDDRDTSRVMRMVGLREIGSGIGILTQPRPAGWLWARVGGDVMDLALLGTALASDRARPGRVVAATVAVAGVTALDALCAQRLSQRAAPGHELARRVEEERAIHVRKAITIGKPAEEIYRFWRDLENLPRFMGHLESVETIDQRRSHWKAKAPFGLTVSWDAEITDDRPNERLAWRSLEGARVPNSGSVSFERAPGGRGTVIRVELRYQPPGGAIGATFARLFGREPGQEVQEDLRALKQVMETGEVVHSDASARGGGPAQPPAERGRR